MDDELLPADEAAVQLIVNTIIGRARMEETIEFPLAYVWGGRKHAELLAERQNLLNAKFSMGLIPFGETEWLRLQSIRGILDGIEEHRDNPSNGACRGGPTLALSDVANGVEEECVLCGMIVRADQVEHPVLGFKARCEK